MSLVQPPRELTDDEKHIFIFAYMKGQMLGIHYTEFPDDEQTKKAVKDWNKKLKIFAQLDDLVCEKVGIDPRVDQRLGEAVAEFENEIQEIVDVYFKPDTKRNKT